MDAYFQYIKGEIKKKKVKTGKNDPVTGRPLFDIEDIVVRPPEDATITGLALWMGFSSLETLKAYESRKEFAAIGKRGRLLVQMAYEKKLSTGKPTGAIFALKNISRNDWEDKTVLDHENLPPSDIKVTIEGGGVPFAGNETEIDLKGLPDVTGAGHHV